MMQRMSSIVCLAVGAVSLIAWVGFSDDVTPRRVVHAEPVRSAQALQAQVLRGRYIVLTKDCGGCHGGFANPAAENWLVGVMKPEDVIPVGEFMTRPRNLTPDSATGLGAVSERQIFNALRYGLRPKVTPDVQITSATPGVGGHPLHGKYLSPSMPWTFWRYMPDADLRAVAAYLKHGLKPVRNLVPDSDAPPDFWASASTPDKTGPYPWPAFPTVNEVPAMAKDAQVQRGRRLAQLHACSGCHGGDTNPAAAGYLGGITSPQQEFKIGPFTTRPRNITPDNTTGIGRFTERQIFNALRWGLRPGETPDIVITSPTPGQGNHPLNPKYLAPPMPWPNWRHLSDDELWAIVAYLKKGVKPVRNQVADSEGPPDFWMSDYTPSKIGSYPVAPFPTAKERAVGK